MIVLPFVILWSAWGVYWVVSSRRVKAAARSEGLGARLVHDMPLVLAAILIGTMNRGQGVLAYRVVPPGLWSYSLSVALTALGLGLAVWARACLGDNWSSDVTVKRDHELVQRGPYALVRHPIYAGLILALAGGVFARGQIQTMLGFALGAGSFLLKMRVEERWMRESFGEAYGSYAASVPSLIPWFGRRTPGSS
jgi:protein-S-isoprenylcysteine O-methyltransferase Ste14